MRDKDQELKRIIYEGKTLHKVGCRKCGGGDWIIFTDGKGKFVGSCLCGNKIEIGKEKLTSQPDIEAIPLYLFT